MTSYTNRSFRTSGAVLVLTTLFVFASANVANADDAAGGMGQIPPPSFYISLPSANDLGVVDPSTGEIQGVIPFVGGPREMIVDPFRPIVYVALGSQQIVAFQTEDQLPIGSVTLPIPCVSYAINASGSKIYASGCGDQSVYLANTKTFTLTGSIPLPSGVSAIAISNRRHRLYAALPTLHSIAVINLDSGKIEKIKYLGQCTRAACSPDDVVVSPNERYLISLDGRQCETIEYDLDTGHVVGRTPDLGVNCGIIGVDAFANELWLEGTHRHANFEGVSMIPPFNGIESFRYNARFGSVAFSPSGQGFAVGSGPDFRNPNVLVAFPTLELTTTLWAGPYKIVYVP